MIISKSNIPSHLDLNEGNLLLIDKPSDITSFGVVKDVRDNYPGYVRKIGHAGTLDPIATGLLILCTGKMTKKIEEIQNMTKGYTGTIRLGGVTPSYDTETEVSETKSINHLTDGMVNDAAKSFEGEIAQFPPAYSAVKIKGKRAYKEAWKGNEVKLKSKPVSIYKFEITRIEWPDIHFEIHCSKGTYVRSLAHDFGQYLKVGGYITSLRRIFIGDYLVEDALSLPEIDDLFQQTKTSSLK